MRNEAFKFAVGTFSFLVFTLLIYWVFSLRLFLPSNLIWLVTASTNPRIALWMISILISSSLISLLKLGVKVPQLQPFIEKKDHPIFNYLLGLPLGIVLSILVISFIGLVLLKPVCISPYAEIEDESYNNVIIRRDGNDIIAKTGEKIDLIANIQNDTITFCSWNSMGDAIKKIDPINSCRTSVFLSNEPGIGVVTLRLSTSYCSLESSIPVNFQTVP